MQKFASLWSIATIVGAVISFAALSSNHLTAATTDENPITRLMGYWSGHGLVVTRSGPEKQFKCVVTYRPTKDGELLRQTMRCRNSDGKFEAITTLLFSGDSVTGKWTETTHNLGGDVSGKITDEGFDVHLSGRFFQAKMRVSSTACDQLVELTPVQTDQFKELSASLKKRC